ncbi:hypothetical protein CALCODRAFT_498819 [Calocera cornea HHB12733]|uniref:Ricin B lectin domain-containing protein n=1 Tax=Calocera cornea HHB12733 TaxID=1353952 RepID=A0A165EQL4_9BASI|nr:hypothetical protein CALCODRAFT_498819 [Calocera cornea HHB12733]
MSSEVRGTGQWPFFSKAIHIPNGTYTIVNVQSGTALSVKDTKWVVGDQRERPLLHQPAEQWKLEYDWTQKGYTFLNASTGRYMTSDQLYYPLVQGQTEVFQSSDKCYFTVQITTVTGAYFIVPNDYDPWVLEVFQGSPADGTAIQIVKSDGSSKQLWTFGVAPQ